MLIPAKGGSHDQCQKKYGFAPDYAVPPGESLREVIASFGMSQKELARRTGITVQSLNRIFKGNQPISSYETANRLELATGVPAAMWNNIEAQYREQIAKIHERERLRDELDRLKEIPAGKPALFQKADSNAGMEGKQSWRKLTGTKGKSVRPLAGALIVRKANR